MAVINYNFFVAQFTKQLVVIVFCDKKGKICFDLFVFIAGEIYNYSDLNFIFLIEYHEK